MTTNTALVELFRIEYEATHSLDAAVGAVVTAVRAAGNLPRLEPPPPPRPSVSAPRRSGPPPGVVIQVLEAVACACDVNQQDVYTRRWTTRRDCAVRWIAATMLRRMQMSLGAIAAAVGLADHTTVHYGLRQVEARSELRAQADAIWQAAPWRAGERKVAA